MNLTGWLVERDALAVQQEWAPTCAFLLICNLVVYVSVMFPQMFAPVNSTKILS